MYHAQYSATVGWETAFRILQLLLIVQLATEERFDDHVFKKLIVMLHSERKNQWNPESDGCRVKNAIGTIFGARTVQNYTFPDKINTVEIHCIFQF